VWAGIWVVLFEAILPPTIVWSSLVVIPFMIWSGFTYTRWHNPFPSVATMVLQLLIQIGVWGYEYIQ
jgi:hypothetical protein